MKAYHPDDSGMTWQDKDKNKDKRGNGGLSFAAFAPGQLSSLAADLNTGFGGGVGQWKDHLRQTSNASRVANFPYGGNRGHGGGQNNGGGNNPGPGPKPGDGGFDPSSPRNRMMPMAAQMPMQMQIPQMGLLNAPMPQPQQQGLLGSIPPEVLAYIRTGGMR